jgi:DNA polymerase V
MDVLQANLKKIRNFYKEYRRFPTQREICTICNFSSRNQAYRLVKRMDEEGYIQKDEYGRVIPKNLLGIPYFSQSVQAGSNSLSVDEELRGFVSLDEMMVFDLKEPIMFVVSGDSMTGEGIFDGSLIIGERTSNPRQGDVVIIELDGGGRSVKYYKKDARGRVSFESAHPLYKPIYPNDQECITIIGIVKWVINKK